ncbi:hypothetical protein F7731_03005 [Cytobacillus depressus]|uniref:YqfQ-like protein n=1 Tax=Cytobacillus depressus TaxID=1602942 RepID=A0A6L3VBH1_9BACI|nr:VrrA/YqfQ family protein [Cytobacillus depressus]KAB2338542.1 hypothetical protein F7731_03005 [Cytobacillus depressus]
MINGPRAPFHGGMPPHAFRNQMFGPPPMGFRGAQPFMRGPGAPMGGAGGPMARGGFRGLGVPQQMRQGGGSGGLFSKLLGRGNSGRGLGGGAMQTASRAAGAGNTGAGGILKSLSDPGAVTGFLQNTQKVLNTAQQIGPMVQQYGPLVRNIPAIWKLYRGIKGSSNETSEEKEKEIKKPKKTKKAANTKKQDTPIIEESTIENEKKAEIGMSKPKLYV